MIYLDIETARGGERRAPEEPPSPPPPPHTLAPPSNYKDPVKIRQWQMERHRRLQEAHEAALAAHAAGSDPEWEGSSLDPLRGEVLCVGVAVDDGPVRVLWSADERSTLELLQRGLEAYPEHGLCAYRGIAFDFDFLARRALRAELYGLARRAYCPRPWPSERHVDPYAAWCGAQRSRTGRLEEIAAYLGIAVGETAPGSEVPELWAEAQEGGELATPLDEARALISAHCAEDVRVLREVHRRMARAGWCAS